MDDGWKKIREQMRAKRQRSGFPNTISIEIILTGIAIGIVVVAILLWT